MNRLLRWAGRLALASLVATPLVVGTMSALAGPSLVGSSGTAQLSPKSAVVDTNLGGARVSLAAATPKAGTDQILGFVQGVAVKAGASYAQAAGGAVTSGGSAPIGGVDAGFGGGASATTVGFSPVVVSVSALAFMFAFGAVGLEVHRRRRAATG
jgi:hypothetical protein